MRILLIAMVLLLLTSCGSLSSSQRSTEWVEFESAFFADFWRVYPKWAFGLGHKDFAGDLKIPNRAYWVEQKEFLLKHQQRLATLSLQKLTVSEKTDYELVKNFIESGIWELDVFKSYQWDPSQYNLGSSLTGILESKSMSGSEKLSAMLKKLKLVPAYYKAAFEQLQKPTQEHLNLTIKQHQALADFLDKQFLDQVLELTTQLEQKKQVREGISQAVTAVKEYVSSLQFLSKTLAREKSYRNFRIGKKLYTQKFKYDLESKWSADEVYQKALAAKKETHREMIKLAMQLWSAYFDKKNPPANPLAMVQLVLQKISQKHTTPEAFVNTVRAQIPELWKFVEEKQLLTLDPQKPLVVRETPVYNRGFAGAGVNAPGPFDQKRETFYEVTPLDGMTPERQQSYLREYNEYTLQILNIHEAIPGHYAQLVYSLKSPSLVKKVFGSGTMVEGWAVYSERMMLEEGYGNNQPEMWLMYYKWRLRVICNTILDYSLHNLDMDRKAALKLLMVEAFQEKTEAEEKWNRATYSQVQLASYFTGFTEIYEYREELKKKMGPRFDLKTFHEKFLSYGSAPIHTIQELMNKEIL
ncbi:DUF885 domain-containing protein [bacterium]|nr:DUF885 domain-containing protein [bacterium]